MRRLISLLLALLGMLAPLSGPAGAQTLVYEALDAETPVTAGASWRFVEVSEPAQPGELPRGIASYGPFRLLNETRAALVDVTDEHSPAAFAALLRDHPGLRRLDMIECPGTEDDRANLKLGRMIRAQGLETHVPHGGSVRSGGVELFLAGTRHTAAPDAEFAVHAWADEDGRGPRDYPADAPQNRAYIDYYREMGMTAPQAAAFYAMTNAVPFESARWLSGREMAAWVDVAVH